MDRTYSYRNAKPVLEVVEAYIKELQEKRDQAQFSWQRRQSLYIREVYDELSIFDWWRDNLSLNNLIDMRKFLREAIKLGYTGYVCFKVGATGCANGMWAAKEESKDGYSPDGPTLYKSFTPAYEYWSINPDGKGFLPDRDEYDKLKNIKMLEQYMKENGLYE